MPINQKKKKRKRHRWRERVLIAKNAALLLGKNNNDHKVDRTVNYKGTSLGIQLNCNLVHVYSPSTGSWRHNEHCY